MNPTVAEGTSETIPLKSEARRQSYFPVDTAGQTFGTTYFLVSALVASIIPIIQLTIGLTYNGQCQIDQRIATYMIVAGSTGIALAALSLLLAATFLCLISDSTTLNVLATCGICLNVTATILLSIFSFIWFIVGCVWVFSVTNDVQFQNSSKGDYCQPVLYRGAFVLLILTIVWFAIQCCVSCFRQCCTGKSK